MFLGIHREKSVSKPIIKQPRHAPSDENHRMHIELLYDQTYHQHGFRRDGPFLSGGIHDLTRDLLL